MLALMDAIEAGRLNAQIAVVVSNLASAAGIGLAAARGYATKVIPNTGLTRAEHEALVIAELKQHNVSLVCLAGYMRLLSAQFIQAFPRQILNIHPSLLPAFPGLNVQQQAIDYGVKFSGCTVHLVDEQCDHGPIVAQAVVPVLANDTADSLAARILVEEHRIYAQAVAQILAGDWTISGRCVVPKSVP